MAKRSLNGLRAIVTGASSGIGRELVCQLAGAGVRVVALARREDRLRTLAGECAAQPGEVTTVAGDVTESDVRDRAVETADSRFGGLDILVNNAGIGAMGLFEDADPQRLRRIMEVNFFALVEMTRLALPLLRRGTTPMIVNVSSILGRRGVPYNSEYAASKFAVHGFSESLRTELARHGIDVLVVSPGTTETEFFDSVIERTGAPAWPEHRPISAAEVARKTILAMRRGRHEIVPYFWGKVLLGMNRLSPTFVDRLMTRYVG
ncbi:MAG: SDR family oxidoreductase [Thermoguttaceae bacterium]|jgi:short-subunit dehydrogenase|nr:SDR family oxidoreductase [Thermoguttaceae bacterium]